MRHRRCSSWYFVERPKYVYMLWSLTTMPCGGENISRLVVGLGCTQRLCSASNRGTTRQNIVHNPERLSGESLRRSSIDNCIQKRCVGGLLLYMRQHRTVQ